MVAISFDNKVTTGNLLTVAGALCAAVLLLGTLNAKNVQQDGRIDAVELSTKYLSQRLDDQSIAMKERLAEIRSSQARIEERLGGISDQIANKQDRPKQ